MNLTTKNVTEILKDCLFEDSEDKSNAKIVEGLKMKVGFNPIKLEKHKRKILEMLNELPEAFKQNSGGGWSFLQACQTKDGIQWGEHSNIDELLCLGMAIDKVEFLMPRDMWNVLPGGMPYFKIIE